MKTATSARALLIDITRCIGCRACVQRLQDAHGFPGERRQRRSCPRRPTRCSWTRATTATCAGSACTAWTRAAPASARWARSEDGRGPVTYDASRCLGLPLLHGGLPVRRAALRVVRRRCPRCASATCASSRAASRAVPACVEACPAEATVAGTREELLAEAHRRIAREPRHLLPARLRRDARWAARRSSSCPRCRSSELGFRRARRTSRSPDLTWAALEKIPAVVSIGGAALMAIWWITHRREEVAAARGRAGKRRSI